MCFNKHAFCFYYRISVSTCTVFFAPYRRFAYILPKCFACISSKHFLLFIEKACFDNTFFVFIIAFPSALTVPYFLHRTGVLRTFCPNVLRTFRPNIFYCLSKKGVFQQTRFLFLISHIRQHFCTVFFAPYRSFAYILSKFTLFSREKSVSVYDTLYL